MNQIPKLTPRQRTFLDKLVELCHEHHGPVHYSYVAERLGVNRFSAYDMLKVLEKKGFASSSYALATGHSGPGRSLVVFAPTPQARRTPSSGAHRTRLIPGEDWQSVRARVLDRLREARETSQREVVNDLLSCLPEARAPLVFCAEMIGVLLLNMRRAGARAAGLSPFRALAALRANGAASLETLAGLSVGSTLSSDDEAGLSATQKLLEYARRYQAALSRLSEEARTALALLLEEALEAFE